MHAIPYSSYHYLCAHHGINIPQNPLKPCIFGSVLDKSEMRTSTTSTLSCISYDDVYSDFAPPELSVSLYSLSVPELLVSKADTY